MSRLSKRSRILIIVAAGVLVVGAAAAIAGPIIYRDVIVGEAAEAPVVDTESLEASTLDPDAMAGEWSVGEGSYAGYRVDEVLNGTDVTVTGRTEQLSGTVTTTDTAVTAASIEVDVASIATDSSSRDAYFRDSALHVSENPSATFELSDTIEGPGEVSFDTEQTVTATGILTLNGVSNEVTVEMTAVASGDTIRIAGQIPITFADYDVEAPSLGFVKVEPDGFVEFLLVVSQAR